MLTFSTLSPQKRAFLAGTLLLTGTGFACRLLGFFYRIFLSRTVGAEGLGLYNMVHPVFGICFSVCAGSVQTALSQYIAAHTAQGKKVFQAGMIISMALSVIMAFGIANSSHWIASHILLEERCAPLLPVIALSVPFAAFHACINGYYYGMQKSRVPAFSQVAEQVIRMGLVFLIADIWVEQGREITVELAVLGHLIGEAASALFTLCSLCMFPPQKSKTAVSSVSSNGYEPPSFLSLVIPLMSLALPLMGNRLVLNLLGSAEAIWIPSRLQAFGLSSEKAFSIYGVLTGMAMPFILFPSAITNSMAVLLLPTVAKAQSAGNKDRISNTISMAIRYSMYMGIFCVGIFRLYGRALGTGVFHDSNAGTYISILAWLCPFMYLATTMGSILNGLGKTSTTFSQNIAAMALRLVFVLFGIPRFGILAYLWGLLGSEILLACLNLCSLARIADFSWAPWETFLKPALALLLSIGFCRGLFSFPAPCFRTLHSLPVFLSAALQIGFIGISYGGILLVLHVWKRK